MWILKALATVLFVLFSAVLIAGSFYALQIACLRPEIIESGADQNSEASKPSKDNPAEKSQQPEPSATFDLRVTEPNKIEGNYYTKSANREGSSWTRNFFCGTKLGEFAVACFTFFLVIFTALLWRSTEKLSTVTENSTKITQAIEIPIPLISAFKLVQYEAIPGENSILDPVPGGAIPQNCRILFVIENKGRFLLRCTELCVEKFIGQSLPDVPTYSDARPWGMYLEKGPIWIRFADEQAALTREETTAANAVYPQGAFWVYGYVTYLGLLGERLQYKFLWRWDLAAPLGFVPEIRPEYSSGATVI